MTKTNPLTLERRCAQKESREKILSNPWCAKCKFAYCSKTHDSCVICGSYNGFIKFEPKKTGPVKEGESI